MASGERRRLKVDVAAANRFIFHALNEATPIPFENKLQTAHRRTALLQQGKAFTLQTPAHLMKLKPNEVNAKKASGGGASPRTRPNQLTLNPSHSEEELDYEEEEEGPDEWSEVDEDFGPFPTAMALDDSPQSLGTAATAAAVISPAAAATTTVDLKEEEQLEEVVFYDEDEDDPKHAGTPLKSLWIDYIETSKQVRIQRYLNKVADARKRLVKLKRRSLQK
eukprot:TRINITY_DN2847_c0_g1_i3.p1 TRINITY_DN2847_c0_g1~~TRINITY_DN2847_c0_g1_i3.p1  ORF type:complete len:222 (+),score=76.51 TRINITY_DN2847_c0_g1_i3:67-732(+)